MLTAIGDVLRECYARGWITTRDGNISLRMSLDGKISPGMYITPRGVRKNTIHPEHIIRLDVTEISELTEVSTEFHMHRNLLLDAKSTRCVVHVHPTYTVAAMHAGIDIQEVSRDFPELKRYTRVGPTVPKCEAGSMELAELTNRHLRGIVSPSPQSSAKDARGFSEIVFDIVGQVGHGVCAIGKHPWDAFEHIERLEHICQIVLASVVGRGRF